MSHENERRPKHRWAARTGIIGALVVAPLALLAAVLIGFQGNADASSHREAPAISKDPFADTTDVYTFLSPENEDNLVMIGSWIPFEGPEGGPNYYEWDPRAVYEIYVDNDGDARADITYTLSSRVEVANPNTFLYNTGPIDSLNASTWNRRQFITVTETLENGSSSVLVANQPTAPVNIGAKSTPDYDALEQAAIRTSDGVKIYAGPTDDAFWVDLQVFDLLTLRGKDAPIGYGEGNNIPIDSLSGFNVHSLVIEAPVTRLKAGDEPVLGVWAATRRQPMGVTAAEANVHTYVQVSRLGMPLVNEVVIPLALKDAFNSIRPEQDLSVYTAPDGLLQKSVEDPEIGRLLCALYGVPLPGDSNDDCSTEVTVGTPRSGRGDIFDIFLTGMVLENSFTVNTANGPIELDPGFNVNRPDGAVPAEMIRINTDIKDNLCAPTPSRLGVLGGDACGFPNGRRLMDDVVEIELLAVAGAAYEVLDDRDESFAFNADLISVLDDGLNGNDKPFRSTFPYMAQAQSGQEHIHQNPFVALYAPLIRNVAFIFGDAGAAAPLAAAPLLAVALVVPALIFMRRK